MEAVELPDGRHAAVLKECALSGRMGRRNLKVLVLRP